MALVGNAVSSLISGLSSLALEEANRIVNLKENIESLEKELMLMEPLMESIQNMAKSDKTKEQWLEETSRVFQIAADLASQYKRRLAKKKWLDILQFPHLEERLQLALELEKVTHEIRDCSQKGIEILNLKNLNLPFSSNQQTEGNISDSAFNKLIEFLGQNRNLPDNLLEHVVELRNAMAPLDKFLQEVETDAELDERQKLWLQEIKDIFHLIEQSLLTFQCSLEKEKGKKNKCQESFSILLLMFGSLRSCEKDLKEKIIEIQSRIDTITRRYELYAIGGFKAKNGSRVIVPQMRSLKNVKTVKSHPILVVPFLQAVSVQNIVRYLLKAFWAHFDKKPSISALEMDLSLMKALLEDASKMGDSDRRLKVWLEQVMEICHGLRSLDSNLKETIQRKRGLGKIVSLRKITLDKNAIEKKIDDALIRKMRYDIGSFVAINGNVEEEVKRIVQVGCSAQSMPNCKKLEEQVHLMKDLQLIDALLEDVSTMEKLDVRHKVWLEEILGVAQEAREIVQQDFGGIFFRSFYVFMKMRKIRRRMDDICEWKKKYMIHGIKATNGSSRISHNLEAAEAYPSGHFAAEFESLRREVKLMKALQTDFKEMVGLDGKLEAWMEEMHGVIADVDKFTEEYDKTARRRGMYMPCVTNIREISTIDVNLTKFIYLKEKIQDLHERRMRYGIESIKTKTTNVEEPQVIISWPADSSEMVSDKERLLLMQLNEPAAIAASRPESSTSITAVNHEMVPPYLWRCLFYFLLFPAGKEIPARRLIAVWIAEGRVSPKRGEKKPVEYFCYLRLAELFKLRMIEVTRRKHNGKVKAFKLHDHSNLRETLSARAEAVNFFQDASNMKFRLAHSADINSSCYEHINGSKPCSSSVLKSHYKKVTSFFSFDTTEGRKHGENIGNFLHRCIANGCFKLMRIVDLERVFKPKLPSSLGALTGLRYLGLRWTYIERLPDHVSMLLNLQVLDVKRTYISTLPKSIWSMQYLRHLYLSETYRSRFLSKPKSNKSLTELLTLWGAFIDEDSPVVNGLDTILNIRKLGLTCRSMSSSTQKMKSQLEAVGDWIIKLQHLEDLRIKSFDDLDEPSDLHLKPFSGHKNLSTVYLVGRLRYPTIVFEFPRNITDITLSRSELEFDPMVALQSLPNLLILRLLAKSTKYCTMECRKGGFPQLQVLKLWNLENLDEWQLKEGSLPCLMDMEIRNCHKLKMIPNEISQLKALKEFRLSNKFEEEIKKNQFSLWNEIKHVLIVDQE